jgi:beta-lactamase class D
MSTFKIINSLIALDSGVTDVSEEIDWDGGPAWSDELKTRLNLKKALSGSALWYFQILARRIGRNRYRNYLSQCGYGNVQCGSKVDNFWLNGSLMISPVEQLEFISRFAEGQLPFSGSIISAVREMLVLGRSTADVLTGKTGYADSNDEHFGWFVGCLDSTEQSLKVVTLLEMSDGSQLPERREISEECLRLYSIAAS